MARTRIQPNQFASQGGVRQSGGTLPIYTCNTCGKDVVWCESKRTGRKYLVNVQRGYHGQRYYRGNDLHKCEAPVGPIDHESEAKARTLLQAQRALRDGIFTQEEFNAILADLG